MTKKILPTMIGVILAGGVAVAQADVQVMGHIDEAVARINGYDGHGETKLVCTTCSVGFKGSEDLGNGMKALFFLDWQYDINGSPAGDSWSDSSQQNGGLKGRDQYVGLGGGFGTFKFGTMSTTYKAHGALIDPGYRTIAQQRDMGMQSQLHNGRGDFGQGRATNTIHYETPSWNGLKASGQYTLTPGSSVNNGYGGGVEYENGPILVYADYLTNDGNGDNQAAAVGAKFTMDNFSVFGQYEWDGGLITQATVASVDGQSMGCNVNTTDCRNNGDGSNVWMLGGSFTMGNNTLYGGYGHQNDEKVQVGYDTNTATRVYGKTGYNSWEVVGVHSFSKRTLAYIGYVGVNPEENTEDDLAVYTIGMKHTF